jgi:hypothetical protein
MANHQTSKVTSQARSAVLAAPLPVAGFDGIRELLLSLRSRIGPSQIIPLAAALLFAVGCTLWAIQEGVSVPLALMGGYCTIVAGIILCVAQLMLTQVNTSATVVAHTPRKPNYAAWKLVNKLNVSNASRLWCEIEPGHPYTQESGGRDRAAAHLRDHLAPGRRQDHADREAAAVRRRDPARRAGQGQGQPQHPQSDWMAIERSAASRSSPR